MSIINAIILAIVEGLTEFLPVSSTGHLIISSSFLGIEKDEFTKLFEIAVELGAILAVVALYWKKFFDFSRWQFYLKLLIAVIPAIVLGALFSSKIDNLLESPTTVAVMLLAGGIVLLLLIISLKIQLSSMKPIYRTAKRLLSASGNALL